MAVFNFTPWADALVARAKTLWQKEGLTATEIGELIGKSRNAVLGKLNRLGLVGDGSHQPGAGGHRRKPKKVRIAPFEMTPSKGRAKGAGRRLTSLAAVPPPPLLPLKPSKDGWEGIAGAVDGLVAGECRWPLPDRLEAATDFCRAPVVSGRAFPYCAHHYHRATHYVPELYDGIPKREKF